jgi:hypothetical protein
MSYRPIHNYRRKDKLNPGDPDKIIYGSDLQDDFEAIAGNFEQQSDQIDQIQGEIDSLPQYVEEAPVNGTAYVRANASWVPVGATGGGGDPILPPSGGLTFWDEIMEKPEGISTLGYENTVDGGTYTRNIK